MIQRFPFNQLAAALLMITMTTACAESTEETTAKAKEAPAASTAPVESPAASAPATTPAAVTVPTEMAKPAASGESAWLSVLNAVMTGQTGNLALSPLSLNQALLTTLPLTGGQSHADLTTYLGTAVGRPALTDPALVMANRVLVAKDLPLKTDSDVTKVAEPFDFTAGNAADTVNNWVKEKTAGKIDSILDPSEDTAALRLLVLNALYFKGQWAETFDKSLTQEKPFFSAAKTSQPAMMMHAENRTLAYRESGDLEAVWLPFAGDTFAYVVIKGKQWMAGSEVVKALQTSDMAKTLMNLSGYASEPVNLSLPRHQVDYSADLVAPLQGAGLASLFEKADFTPLTAEALTVSAVRQKVRVEVDEEGAEAAAVTAIAATRSAAIAEPVAPREFNVNQPFVALIMPLNGSEVPVVVEVVSNAKKS